MTIRTLVFDFGNVLGSFSHRQAAEQLAALSPHSLNIQEIIDFLYFTDLEPTLELGRLPANGLINLLRHRYDLRGSDEAIRTAYADMFTPLHANCALIPLLKQRYQLLLLSNTNELHYEQFRQQFADTLSHFDHLIVSHEVGLRKPDPRLYQYVEQIAGSRGQEILFIDDLPGNIAGAQTLGWRTLLYPRGGDLAAMLLQAGVEFVTRD
jgi:epoxide hydrolase-like predicted phosphatase